MKNVILLVSLLFVAVAFGSCDKEKGKDNNIAAVDKGKDKPNTPATPENTTGGQENTGENQNQNTDNPTGGGEGTNTEKDPDNTGGGGNTSETPKDEEQQQQQPETPPTPFQVTGNYQGHDYIDLGTGVMWATTNVNGTNLYSWEEAKSSVWSGWRLPSTEELTALANQCYWQWVEDNANKINGYVIYKVKDQSHAGQKNVEAISALYNRISDINIFLPAYGLKQGTNTLYGGDNGYDSGYYWSSTSAANLMAGYAYNLKIEKSSFDPEQMEAQNSGLSIRPVYKPQ